MSFGFFGMSRGYGQEMRREAEADSAARRDASHAREATRAASEVERRLDKLTLISMAMWSFLTEKLQLSEEDLMERVKRLDLMDGVSGDSFASFTRAACWFTETYPVSLLRGGTSEAHRIRRRGLRGNGPA